MAETTWVDGVNGAVASSEVLMTANTVINIYSVSQNDVLRLQKKGPDAAL